MKKWNISGLMVFDEEAMIEVLNDEKSVASFKILKKQGEFNYYEEELEIEVADQLGVEEIREIFDGMEFDESYIVTQL